MEGRMYGRTFSHFLRHVTSYTSILNVEATGPFETSVPSFPTVRSYVPQDSCTAAHFVLVIITLMQLCVHSALEYATVVRHQFKVYCITCFVPVQVLVKVEKLNLSLYVICRHIGEQIYSFFILTLRLWIKVCG
jgi:hypothetical protein